MALQRGELVILGLGIVADTPPNSLQPPLADGIHLRWAFEPRRGFPPHGYYLLRRPHQARALRCLDNLSDNVPAPSSGDIGNGPAGCSRWLLSWLPRIGSGTFPPAASAGVDLGDREHLRLDLSPENLAWLIEVRIGFWNDAEIRVTALSGEAACAEVTVRGRAGDVKTARLEFDAISAVELGGGPATLVDLCFVPVSEDAAAGWEPVPAFPYAMTLPLTHPDYPASGARSEDLAAARALARTRITYGDPDQLTGAPAALTSAGAVRVVDGSPIVRGSGTSWTDELVGAVLQVAGDPTGYTVAAVIDPEKLVLSRPYTGGSSGWVDYAAYRDAFGQLHDYLAYLVAGGIAAGPMLSRSLPSTFAAGGAVKVTVGSAEATGIGTAWGSELAGLSLQLVRDSGGSVDVSHGSSLVRGRGTAWGAELKGLVLQIEGERGAYDIIGAEPSGQLLFLDRSYTGGTASGRAYEIIEKTTYTVARVYSPTRLSLDRAYHHANAAPGTTCTLAYTIQGRSRPGESGEEAPTMPRQYPLDLVLMAALHPAAAQALGLYWVDPYVRPGEAYDYLILADHDGRFRADPREAIRQIAAAGFADVDGYITFNRRAGPAPTLDPPGDVRAFALPGFSTQGRSGLDDRSADARNLAGLRWEMGAGGPGILPAHAVMYHVWRAELGGGETPSTKESYQPITDGRPVLGGTRVATTGRSPEPPPDWPPFPLQFIDSRLPDGWYGYQLSGIDIFGRHSPNSAAAAWHQWTPAPEPRPWYYDEARGAAAVHASAVRLLDRTGPPPPTGVEAYALDPTDPHVIRDDAYRTWREGNPGVVGLRVRWLWTPAHTDEAPDTSEFRIYYEPGRMNAWTGNTLRVSPLGHAESTVETDIVNTQPADACAGAHLHCGADTFRVLGNEAGSPLRLRVAHVGPFYSLGTIELRRDSFVVTGGGTNWGPELAGLNLKPDGEAESYTVLRVETPTRLILKRAYTGTSGAGRRYALIGLLPPARSACTLAPPPPYTAGTLTLVNGSPVVAGTNTKWGAHLVGSLLQVGAEQTVYRIVSVDAPRRLTLDRAYAGREEFERPYSIRHPLFVDYSAPAAWQRRIHVVRFEEHVTVVTDRAVTGDGLPVRCYEVFLPAPDANEGQPFAPSLSDPLVYAHVGVSAADDKTHTPDDPRRDAGDWGGRPGNEGRLGPQATIFRVRRERPPAPQPRPYAGRVFATPADYHGRSFYTYRWRPSPHLETHIFRALDDSVFQTDWSHRQPPRPALSPSELEHFPAEWRTDDDSALARRRGVAEALNRLNEFAHDAAGREQAMAYYRSLSDDALRVLAGLPGNEAAFTQMTIEPLDPADPSTFDRTGPDDPATHTPDPALRAYRDTLDGRSTNRYFYRAAYLDDAHNRSELSPSSPPVYLPDVTPPRTPTVTKAFAGDRAITLQWASNREADLAEYQVYRATVAEAARDFRLMRLAHTVPVLEPPEDRPREVIWEDLDVVVGQSYWYRIVAVDRARNGSAATNAVEGRPFRRSPPLPPEWESADWNAGGTAVELRWAIIESGLRYLVQRRTGASTRWVTVSDWLDRDVTSFTDASADLFAENYYRIKSRDAGGNVSVGFVPRLVTARS